MKKLIPLIVLALSGCTFPASENALVNKDPNFKPPDAVYTIVVSHGPYQARESGIAFDRYYADEIQFIGDRIRFHDKVLNVNISVPSAHTIIGGGHEPILPTLNPQ